MGVKATLRDIQSGFLSASAHTANNTLIEEALNKALDRTASVDNAMEVSLDLGNNRTINQADAVADSDGVTYRQLKNSLASLFNNPTVLKTEYITTFTEGQTAFTLTTMEYAVGVNNIEIVKNGLTLTSGVDYTEDTSTTFTLTVGLTAGDKLLVKSVDVLTNTASSTDAITHYDGSSDVTLSTYLNDTLTESVTKTELAELQSSTLAEAVANTDLQVGQAIAISDRGYGVFDVVLASGVTPNAFNIVQCVGKPSLALSLRVYPEVNLKQFGAKGDGVTDDTYVIQMAVNYALHSGKKLFAPAGIYLLRPTTNVENVKPGTGASVRLDMITADGQGLVMYGAGKGKTIFKEADNETSTGGNFTRMFFMWLDSTEANTFEFGHYHFSGFSLDKNARGNGAPPSLFAWEGCHMIAAQGNPGATKIPSIIFEDIELIDKIGVGLAVGPTDTNIELLVARDIHSPLSSHPTVAAGTIGGKGCIEFGIDSDLTVIENVNCHYSQIEPTHSSLSTRVRRIRVDNCKMDTFEYTDSGGYSAGTTYSFVEVSNTHCPVGFVARGIKVKAVNCILKNSIENFYIDSKFTNCEWLLSYDSSGNSVSSWYANTPSSMITAGVPTSVVLDNCTFTIDSDSVAASPSGFALRANVTTTDYGSRVQMNNCKFDPRLYGVIDAYSTGGHWKFSGCEMAGHAFAVYSGAFSNYKNSIELDHCDFGNVTGVYLHVQSSTGTYSVAVNGTYLASDWSQTTGGAVSKDLLYYSRPKLIGSAAPVSGVWFVGDKVYNASPAAGGTEGWVCTTAGSPGTWKTFGVISA